MGRRLALVVAVVVLLAVAPLAGSGAAQADGPWWDPSVDDADAALALGLVPYHDLGPRLRRIERASERVTVDVVGRSVQGRDILQVTVSDPGANGRLGRWPALRRLMERDPGRAQERVQGSREVKVPVMVHGAVHGDEWEGTDASLEMIEHLARSDDAETRRILDHTIVLFNLNVNPDGRFLGIRGNARGFDLNRDFVTASQPETRAMIEQIRQWSPLVLLDTHGYVNPYLVEPTTPPHNPNYEQDLHLAWMLSQAEAIEDAVEAGYADRQDAWTEDIRGSLTRGAQIPFRDREWGWDGWPPIFTPMYAMYHGSFAATLEAPLRPDEPGLSAQERRARAELNVRAHYDAVWAALLHTAEHKREMLHDQIEVLRRGAAGDPRPDLEDAPPEVRDAVEDLPEAYVVPAGTEQRSDVAAARLVNHLRRNGVRVEQATEAFTVDGVRHPAGSSIVPLAQPRRGLANTLLATGVDLSASVPSMYDIAAWSHAELWGATVTAVPADTGLQVATRPVRADVAAPGSVAHNARAYTVAVDDPAAVTAVNRLLDDGVAVERADDGTVVIPATARARLERLAAEHGLDFRALDRMPAPTRVLEPPAVALAAPPGDRFALAEMGFNVDAVSTTQLNDGVLDLADYDVLYVATTGFDHASLDDGARTALTDWFGDGGGIVGVGSGGAFFNADAGLLDVDFQRAPPRANGIAHVVNQEDSPLVGHDAGADTTFVYRPVWFELVGNGAHVDVRFAGRGPLAAGHWAGQSQAAGEALVVRGTAADTGARVALFGSQPLFRDHPKKLYAQVAHALWWAAGP